MLILDAEATAALDLEARRVLDAFEVPQRLEHVRRYVWRDGLLRFGVDDTSAGYLLEAHWPALVLEPLQEVEPELRLRAMPVVEGRWVRGTAGYVLRVGIDRAIPSAMFVRGDRLQSFVPFVGRTAEGVEQALQHDLEAYVRVFLSRALAGARSARGRGSGVCSVTHLSAGPPR